MRILLIALLLMPFLGNSQLNRKQTRDSIRYYNRQMSEMHRAMRDSLFKNPVYKNAMDRSRFLAKGSEDYGSFVFFVDIADADFNEFNTSIVASGFPALDGPVYRLGFGMSFKTRNTIVDFYSVAGGLPKRSKKGNETIETNFSSAAILDIGIDLAKSPSFNFYPYAGLSLRTSDLSYEKPATINPSFTNISNLILNNQSVTASSTRLGVQAGIGFEFVLTASREKNQMADGGFIFFVKAGTNLAIGKENYDAGPVDYDPGIAYGKWIITAGIKIFGKK